MWALVREALHRSKVIGEEKDSKISLKLKVSIPWNCMQYTMFYEATAFS
jgi:hypothetical protein